VAANYSIIGSSNFFFLRYGEFFFLNSQKSLYWICQPFFLSRYGEFFKKISKIPLLDFASPFFCCQVVKIRHKKIPGKVDPI
jgi:hypothetical protein